MKWQIGNRVFSSWGDVEDFLKGNEEYSIEDVIELSEEEDVIIESEEEEENLVEDEGISEKEVEEIERGETVLKAYRDGEIDDEELKKMILSKALGQETHHSKDFIENTGTRGAIEHHVQTTIEKLADPASRICPFCNMEIASAEITSKDNVMAKILHCKKEHKEELSTFTRIVGFPTERDAFETEEPTRTEGESGIKMEHQRGSPNPEACSESEKEELSKEELTAKVILCPQLREKLYKLWIEKKQQRK